MTTPARVAEAPRKRDRTQARTFTRRLTRRERFLRRLALRERGYQLGLLVAVLAVWEYAGRQSPGFTFAPPSSMVPAAREMISSGELQSALGDSVVVLLSGFALAAVVGIGIGYAMGWWRVAGRTLDPFVSAIYVVPIAALVPVIIAWFGLGVASRLIVVFLFALFEILLAAYAGVKNVDLAFIDVARTFGARRRDLLLKAVVPASLSFVFVGLRLGASRALKGMVLAEMLFAITGLGGLIIKYAEVFRMDRVLVVIATIALVGILITAVVQAAERYVMRWRRSPRANEG